MARNRVLYIIAAVCCLAFSMLYRENISAVLLAAVAAYPVLAAITVFLLLKLVKADFSESMLTSEKGTGFELIIDAENRCILPCVPMEMVCDLPDEDTGLVCEKKIFVTLPPLGKTALSLNCMNRYRGKYIFKVKSVSVYDPLKIIRLTKKGKSSVTAVFVPRKLNISEIKDYYGNENFSARRQNANENKEDFSHVRDYIQGENAQLVHWKLTAKQDELMIKQFDSINDRKALVLCDFKSCDGETDPLLCADTVIETATAFVSAFNKENICTEVDFGQPEDNAVRVSNRQEFQNFFELMSVISPKTVVCDFISLIKRAAGAESMLVLVTCALTEELLLTVNKFALEETVLVAYINLSGKAVERDYENGNFIFMNICGSGQDALTAAEERVISDM